MMKRRDVGNFGEMLARDFLEKNGYRILETDYRCPLGEMDIIARQEDTLVFVEVRTKTSQLFSHQEESVTPENMEKLREVAEYYQQNCSNLPEAWRIDVVAIELNRRQQPSRIEIIENAVGEA